MKSISFDFAKLFALLFFFKLDYFVYEMRGRETAVIVVIDRNSLLNPLPINVLRLLKNVDVVGGIK